VIDEIDAPPVLCTISDRYAIVRLNRPAEFNRLTATMLGELEKAFSSLGDDEGLAAVIVTGTGGLFSAGADLKDVVTLTPQTALEFSRRGQSLMAMLDHPRKISIAAIDGHCLGGGLDLALGCDLRYATARASFQHPGAQRGIITGWGGTVRLPRTVGLDAARRIFVSGEKIDAAEALRIGLVNEVCDDALARACQVAEEIIAHWTTEKIAALKASLAAASRQVT
jgi:enoyl-CoA hydratase/carnithine racemase